MIYPIAAMALLTFIIGLLAVKARFSSVKNQDVSVRYFKLMQGDDVPEIVTKTTRCFNNQFEVPILFYVAGVLYISLGIESVVGLVSAWVFVALRCVHAYIHLTYNNILHRLSAFWLAFVVAMIMWGNLIVSQL
ncbi:hypothetical protein EYS14_00825 [Alteromonadaceae bacterium M269]|nr:hypothetical protein EYS14_00825 [Alteromonadaceae bacterium M269]